MVKYWEGKTEGLGEHSVSVKEIGKFMVKIVWPHRQSRNLWIPELMFSSLQISPLDQFNADLTPTWSLSKLRLNMVSCLLPRLYPPSFPAVNLSAFLIDANIQDPVLIPLCVLPRNWKKKTVSERFKENEKIVILYILILGCTDSAYSLKLCKF